MPLTPLDIFRLLNKSNCKDCGLPTCLSFAQAVVSGGKYPGDCPHLGVEAAHALGQLQYAQKPRDGFTASIDALRAKVRDTDIEAMAGALGAVYADGRLSVRVLGREFFVDRDGGVSSQCHINNWIQWLVLTYVSTPSPRQPEGRWVPFGELKGGATTAAYFAKRFEEPLRIIADEHTSVLFELLGVFGGKSVAGFGSDYAVSLLPLPNVPMLVLYWRPEEGFPSKLRVMFDPAASSYLGPELITGLGRGIIEMLQKIIPKHEKGVLNLPYV